MGLRKLTLENFVKHKHLELEFENGITVISGRNGAGKSLVSEAVEFALFGVKALRGSKTDYPKDMKVSLFIEIKGKPYLIERTLENCNVNGTLVVGTKESNSFLERTLGFGQDVYEFSIFAKQFDLMNLTKVAPAERKRSVDNLIGAEKIESVIKYLRSKKNTLSSNVEVLKRATGDKPLAPEPLLFDEEKVRKDFEDFIALKSQANAFKDYGMEVEPKWLGQEELLDYKIDKAREIESLLKVNAMYPADLLTQEDIDEAQRALDAYIPYPDLPLPEYTENELEHQSSLIVLKKAYDASVERKCPNCGHVYKDLPKPVEEPVLSAQEIKYQRSCIQAWVGLPKDLRKTDKPKYTQSQIDVAKSGMKVRAKIEELMLETPEKLEDLLKAKSDCEKWDEQKKHRVFSEALKEYDEETLRLQMAQASEHKTAVAVYESELRKYEENTRAIEELSLEEERYGKAIDGMLEYRKRIKTLIIPSLERVASDLVCEMSDGELRRFEISEDFDIKIDGKKVGLLSGSEEALANIALRLSLGRVLTKGVLNLFIGDEIDASMSEERAKDVYDALSRLRGKIQQIVLISHKQLDGDNHITIE